MEKPIKKKRGRPPKAASGEAKTAFISARLSAEEEQIVESLKRRLHLAKDSDVVGLFLRAVANKSFPELLEFLYKTSEGEVGEVRASHILAAAREMMRPRTVPVVQSIAAGELAFADSLQEPMEFLDITGIDCPGNVVALRVNGDSMTNGSWEGGGIQDGDYVLIHEGAVDYGQIAAARAGNKGTLKRVFHRAGDNMVCLRALNPKYDDQLVPVTDFKAYPVCTVIPSAEARILAPQAQSQ